ncbi:ankyrin repeat domain-containing protein [Curvibacter sp. CHRR-16]|uniref:ankyrin repeat domain-containing protein n=1 Tax=Curvibacter sp. CHRR-16 TaxID=2835872 RepID=UPI001BD97174|nr:ankyrin repeat domain-containing protein [Curvibacter sp. CHRR-16]MBT0571234.1 ankyrin repeat domain-containing protein [Curvibacter sp. CHRR-16]
MLKRWCIALACCLLSSVVQAGAYEDFFSAIERDSAPAMRNLLARGMDPNTVNPEGIPAIFVAIASPALDVLAVLVQAPDIQLDVRNRNDETPLMLACLKGMTPLVQQLLAREVDVNKPGWTPLHYAATKGDEGIIQLLLDHYAYIDAESPNGTTPLMMAAMYAPKAAVELLLKAGADPTLKNQLGMTAVDFANRLQRSEIAQVIQAEIRRRNGPATW